MVLIPALFRESSLSIVSGQKILRVRLKYLSKKTLAFARWWRWSSNTDIYRRTLRTLLLKILTWVRKLRPTDLQNGLELDRGLVGVADPVQQGRLDGY